MPSPEHTTTEQPAARPSLEQIVNRIADEYGVDLSQQGAYLVLDISTRPDGFMIVNRGGQLVLARGIAQENGTLSPDLDMAFALGEVSGFDAPDDRKGG